MIFSNTSNYMLKYQKAKAKLVEYDIPQKDYPKFPLNSNELSYPVVYILSRYAESVIENNVADMEEFSPHLVAASQYFDAAVGANDREEYDADFLKSGIEISPVMMPLSNIVYEFPLLSGEPFWGMPGLVVDSLPDSFGNKVIEQWLASQGKSIKDFTAIDRLC